MNFFLRLFENDKLIGDATVLISFRTVYGRELFYGENDLAKIFLKLIGKSTFSRKDLELIKTLGFGVELKSEQIEI